MNIIGSIEDTVIDVKPKHYMNTFVVGTHHNRLGEAILISIHKVGLLSLLRKLSNILYSCTFLPAKKKTILMQKSSIIP